MHSVWLPASAAAVSGTAAPRVTAAAGAPTCIVMLPGAYHRAADLVREGFAASVRRRNLAIDLQLVDVDLEHLEDRRSREQLQHDVVQPARDRGCTSIWLAGISLGGFIALDYATAHGRAIDGICLLAPYLGNRILQAEIAAVGLAAWQPGTLADTDEERRIWRYLQSRHASRTALYLGYGRADRFASGHALLADALRTNALPGTAVDVIAGGHDWPTWLSLWENFLDATFMTAADS